jgi:hypothetical protein
MKKQRFYQAAVHKNIERDKLLRSVSQKGCEALRAMLEENKRKQEKPHE